MSNLIVNGGFEDGVALEGWVDDGAAYETSIVHTGDAAARLAVGDAISQTDIGTQVDATYRLGFYVYADGTEAVPRLTVIINGVANTVDILQPDVWIEESIIFQATTSSTTISFSYDEGLETVDIILDDVTLVALAICYSGTSIVKTKNKITNLIEDVKANEIHKDIHEVYSINDKKFVPVIHNIVTGPVEKYILIEKNLLDDNKPTEDFYVTGGHVIIVNGTEIKARDIPNVKKIKVKPESVYSICLSERKPILINGLAVMAWGEKEWFNYADSKKLNWKENYPISN
ncbi:putative ORFan [Tupanvirus deep ocean]|uniref:ORFan n=2 Tax=Tupanvirus TaxID=2094720 RepID=A0AC62A7U8_9VIRU|nr:putative ORFan [Tupanvirus deep ocean]QKU33708.1 putative ORFan [Tupanvirus deep ocean]